PAGYDLSTPPVHPLLRPASENVLNELVVANALNGDPPGLDNQAWGLILRSNANSTTCYLLHINWRDGSAHVLKSVNGTYTILGSNWSAGQAWSPVATGVPYVITFSCFGTSPTVLRVTIRRATTPDTPEIDFSINDSDPALQAAGQVGVRA